MRAALDLAAKASQQGDVPVGAIVLNSDGEVVGRGFNTREVDNDPMNHAEVVAMREAANANGSWRLDDHTLVVTLEPCTMCAGAAVQARIGRIVLVPLTIKLEPLDHFGMWFETVDCHTDLKLFQGYWQMNVARF